MCSRQWSVNVHTRRDPQNPDRLQLSLSLSQKIPHWMPWAAFIGFFKTHAGFYSFGCTWLSSSRQDGWSFHILKTHCPMVIWLGNAPHAMLLFISPTDRSHGRTQSDEAEYLPKGRSVGSTSVLPRVSVDNPVKLIGLKMFF